MRKMLIDRQLHIIVTGESGPGRAFIVPKILVQKVLFISLGVFLVLLIGTISGISFFASAYTLEHQLAQLHSKLDNSSQVCLSQEQESQAQIADIKIKDALLEKYKKQLAKLQKKHDAMLAKSVSRLDERSKAIETIIDALGIDVQIEEDPEHSGGIFIPDKGQQFGDKLILQTDQYLDFLKYTPLGKPINTSISSGYGSRNDPLNKRRAFHEGLDFRGRQGANVSVTADGVVSRSAYSKDFGNIIIVKHKNGYKTLYAHLHKRLVKKGDKVHRGQIIGLVGSTGRSTGAHLHYELHLNGKPVNPMKYVKISKLKFSIH